MCISLDSQEINTKDFGLINSDTMNNTSISTEKLKKAGFWNETSQLVRSCSVENPRKVIEVLSNVQKISTDMYMHSYDSGEKVNFM